MKILQDVRDFAAQQGVDKQAALSKGMEQKTVEFVKQGASFYRRLELSHPETQTSRNAARSHL